jgi:iron complex outermembrane receptor protein/hemoglobin/transferrin/lactoferrin receptor protein
MCPSRAHLAIVAIVLALAAARGVATAGDAPEDAPGDASEETAEDTPEDAPGDASEETAEDTPEVTANDAPDASPTTVASDPPHEPDPDSPARPAIRLAPVEYGTVIVATRSPRPLGETHRAVTVVDEDELIERAARTTPEALELVPGVRVQKTNHAGGSPYIRGRTGQQTLVLIDGFRFNTSIARSGPNQYLSTVDPAALQRIEVLRGAGSVLHGSDAIGGVIHLVSRRPTADSPRGAARLRAASVDRSSMTRAEGATRLGDIRLLVGVGARHFGNLRGAGPLSNTTVPVYEGDVQQFTGYDELSTDIHATRPLGKGELSATALLFRQFDAPRTDTCTPDPLDCRYFDEQFYDLAYLRYEGPGLGVPELDLGAAFASTHERRSRVRAARDSVQHELDRVLTFAIQGRAALPARELGNSTRLRTSLGAESYLDTLASEAASEVMSTGERTGDVRGKYLDGSTYFTGAAFGFAELAIDEHLSVTAGLRATVVRAGVASDPEGGTAGFSQIFALPVAAGGVRVRLTEGLHLVGNLDQGFRAPNLDDLSARSSEGPGYQLPNPELDAETSITFEAGAILRRARVQASAFVYQSYIDGFIARDPATCPAELFAQCGDAQSVFRLINAERAETRGVELAARATLTPGVELFGNITWTVASRVLADGSQVPESKIPPTGGVMGLRLGRSRYFFESIQRFALRQGRLSAADMADPRIPDGGTPAYGVIDFRVGANWNNGMRATLAVENVLDVRYRVHGSGVDGPGLGVTVALVAPFGGP